MKNVTFITGNQNKADYVSKYLGYPIDHIKIDLDELQSLDLRAIVTHKVKQAYEKIGKPVIVEDVSLAFEAMGGLPGPFIKFFVEEMPLPDVCHLVDGKSRKATAQCIFGYYDGERLELIEGHIDGSIAEGPRGDRGYGFDKIFIPEGHTETRAEMNDEDHRVTYMIMKPFEKLKQFLNSLSN